MRSMQSPVGGGFSRVGRGTLGLVIAMVVGFLVNWSTPQQPLVFHLGLLASDVIREPWTLLTYPFAWPGGAIFGILMAALWLWMVGGQVESDLGTPKYLASFFVFTLLGGIFVSLAGLMTQAPASLLGSAVPVGAITMLWAARNRSATIMFWGMIPMSATILAGITALLVFLSHGVGNPLVGVCAVIPLGIAWLWADGKLPVAYAGGYVGGGTRVTKQEAKARERKFTSFMDDVKKREQERRERDELRRLFERSLVDNPDDKKPDDQKKID